MPREGLLWRTGKRSQGVTASAVSSRLLTTQLKNQEAAISFPHIDLLRVSPGTFKNPGILGGSKCDVGFIYLFIFPHVFEVILELLYAHSHCESLRDGGGSEAAQLGYLPR